MERDAIARARRREQALEAMAEEHAREEALVEQYELLILETERERIDGEALARLDPAAAELVREALEPDEWWLSGEDDDFALDGEIHFDDLDDDDADADPAEELGRLQQEVAASRAIQAALARFVEALEALGEAGVAGAARLAGVESGPTASDTDGSE